MILRGFIRTGTLQAGPLGDDDVEMIVQVQGVSPGQPRTLIIPMALLLDDPALEPDMIQGRRFEAEADQDEAGRWLILRLSLSDRVLRPPDA